MSTIWKTTYFKIAILLSLSTHLAVLPLTSQIQPSAPAYVITADHLETIRLHLPSYMPTISELLKYQESLPSHQWLHIEWDSLNGEERTLPKEEADSRTLSYNFRLLDRKHSLPGPLRKSDVILSDNELVIVGITFRNEVRSLMIESDNRVIIGESMLPGAQHTEFFVHPKLYFDIGLPDDEQIVKIVFLKPHRSNRSSEAWQLRAVGSIDLKAK